VTQILFSETSQKLFAGLSGDFNPIHVDAVYVRRLQFGGAVVHGLNLVCRSLDELLSDALLGPVNSLRSLKITFHRSVLVGDKVEFVFKNRDSLLFDVMLNDNNGIKAKMEIQFSTDPRATSASSENEFSFSPAVPECPDRIEAGETSSISHRHNRQILADLFPNLALLPNEQIGALLAFTRLVGMIRPGLNSLFSSFSVQFSNPNEMPDTNMSWRIETLDHRYNVVTIAVTSNFCQAQLTSFLRDEPYHQPSIKEFTGVLKADLFKGRRALVIGGSRGLGEVTAKLLAVAGADVTLTYHTGLDDARRVQAELREAGCACEIVQLDVTESAKAVDAALAIHRGADLCFYFASPRISESLEPEFNTSVYEGYLAYYFTGFSNCVSACIEPGRRTCLFLPSTIFITDGSNGYREYVAAKRDAEKLCQELETSVNELKVVAARLPAMPTDQTTGLVKRGGLEDPTPIMAQQVKAMAGKL
jgi:hypothetical protein